MHVVIIVSCISPFKCQSALLHGLSVVTTTIIPTNTLMGFGSITCETQFVTCLLDCFTLKFTLTNIAVGMRAMDSATAESTPVRVMIAETVIDLSDRERGEPFIGDPVVRGSA